MAEGAMWLTSEDVGAPAVNNTAGSLCSVLDWALVTKHGGWAIEYTGTNKRIYRAAVGNRFRLRVCHDSAESGLSNFAAVRAAEGASGIDTLVDPFPQVAQEASNGGARWPTAYGTNSGYTCRYKILVMNRRFYLWVGLGTTTSGPSSTYYWHFHYFGDFPPTNSADVWSTGISSRGSTSTSTTSASMTSYYDVANIPSLAGVSYWARSIDGTIKSTKCNWYAVGATYLGLISGLPTARGGWGNGINIEKVAMNCAGVQSGSFGITTLMKRAWAPNLWNPLHSGLNSTVGPDDTFTVPGYTGGVFVPISFNKDGTSNDLCGVVVETTDTWEQP